MSTTLKLFSVALLVAVFGCNSSNFGNKSKAKTKGTAGATSLKGSDAGSDASDGVSDAADGAGDSDGATDQSDSTGVDSSGGSDSDDADGTDGTTTGSDSTADSDSSGGDDVSVTDGTVDEGEIVDNYRLPTSITCKYEAKTAINHAYGYFSAKSSGLVFHQWRDGQNGYSESGTGTFWFKKGSKKVKLGGLVKNSSSSLEGWTMQWHMNPGGNTKSNLMDSQEAIKLKSYFASMPTATVNSGFTFGDTGFWPTKIRECEKKYEDVRTLSRPNFNGF